MNEKLELETFISDGEKSLEEIDEILSKFNGFEVIKKVHSEILHSNILAWLLNPSGNHGLNELFLKEFLIEIIPDAQYYSTIKFIDFQIFSERSINERRIDILITSVENSLVIGIENKIFGKEMDMQLEYYFKGITEEFASFTNKFFIYLTPEGFAPSDEENWIAYDYSQVENRIGFLLENNKSDINEDVFRFLNHYNKIINRYITKRDIELEKICTKLFHDHKNALNIIFQYKPDICSDIQKVIVQLIKSNDYLKLDHNVKNNIKFSSKKLDETIPKDGSGKWSNEKRVLLFEFKTDNNRMNLNLVIGPAAEQNPIRKKLLDIARKDLEIFKEAKAEKSTKKYRQIYQKNILSKKFYEEENMDSIKKQISMKFKGFLNELIKIENHFVKHYK